MAKNSFKLLEEDMEAKFENSSQAIKKNINSRKDLWTLIGDLFELYVPRLFNSLIGGGSSFSNRLQDKKLNERE